MSNSTVATRLIDNYLRIPKLNDDGSNWVIYKDKFLNATAASGLTDHLETLQEPPNPFPNGPPSPISPDEQSQIDSYEASLRRYKQEQAIIKQGMSLTISDSLYMDVRGQATSKEMWELVVKRMKIER
jgi:hypothetical protein